MRSYRPIGWSAVIVIGCLIVSCASPTPAFLQHAEVDSSVARVVVVAPVGGIGAFFDVDSGPRQELHPGGSIWFDVTPGVHTLNWQVLHSGFLPNKTSSELEIRAGATLYLTLNPSGPRQDSPHFSNPSLPPPSYFGPLNLTLMPVSREKAARIAAF